MLIEIYLVVQIMGLLLLGLAFINFNGRKKQFLFGFLACFLFLYLAIGSADITKDECVSYDNLTQEVYIYGDNYSGYHFDHYGQDASPSLNDLNLFHTNITSTGDITCKLFHYSDSNQMFFNIGLVFLSLIYSIAVLLIQKGNA